MFQKYTHLVYKRFIILSVVIKESQNRLEGNSGREGTSASHLVKPPFQARIFKTGCHVLTSRFFF